MADVEQFLHRFHVWTWTHVRRMALPMESSLEDDVCAGYGCRTVTEYNIIQARTVPVVPHEAVPEVSKGKEYIKKKNHVSIGSVSDLLNR